MNVTRFEVYNAVDSERDYQADRWKDSVTGGDDHSLEEWLMYIEHHVGEAKRILSTQARQIANPAALEHVRKITALGVAAMEQHGAPQRVGFER